MRIRPIEAALGAVAFVGIMYLFLWGRYVRTDTGLPSGLVVCALLWLPGLILILARSLRRTPFRVF